MNHLKAAGYTDWPPCAHGARPLIAGPPWVGPYGRERPGLSPSITIVIPPLRDRPEDVLALANYFLQNLPHSGSGMGISKDAQAILVSYPWPGNIRELKAVIGKCALLTDSDIIQPNDLPAHMKARHYESPHKSKTLEDMEKEHIINVLAETEGNQTKASEILGINRKTLYKKIHRYKIFS